MNKRGVWILGGLVLVVGLWNLVAGHFGEEEKHLRRRLRRTVTQTFPEKRAAFIRSLGLVRYSSSPKAQDPDAPAGEGVVLIHGLDDPGKVWQSLAPELAREGFEVWLMHYPNDQPIADSARFFFEHLKELKALGVSRISIVAHSMGGLVSREVLTQPEIGYLKRAAAGGVPQVDRLIMVGTPNHGSQLVRFRLLAEVREHLTRLAQGEGVWLGTILDGAGEAKIDLLPGSRFLSELNARPHPRGVEQLIIAGMAAPWGERQIAGWLETIDPQLSGERKAQLDNLGRVLVLAAQGLGDGLVSVDSTRLKGVAHQTVAGTHLTMIRNLSAESGRVPPAVPVILARLKAPVSTGSRAAP